MSAITMPQMCTVDDLIGGEACLRVAQVVWQPEEDGHPVYLCRFHAEPFPEALVAKSSTEGEQ